MGRLTGCCWCFNLKDGARAVGITMLVLGSLGLLGTVISAIVLSQQTYEWQREQKQSIVVRTALQVAAYVLHLIFNALLVHGVGKDNRGMILAWLIYHGIVTGLQSVAMFIILIIVFIHQPWWLAIVIICISSLVGVSWYWFTVVLHHYKEMHQQNGFVYGRHENEGEKHAM